MAEAGEEPRAFGYLALERQRQAELQRLWSEFTIVRCDLSDEVGSIVKYPVAVAQAHELYPV